MVEPITCTAGKLNISRWNTSKADTYQAGDINVPKTVLRFFCTPYSRRLLWCSKLERNVVNDTLNSTYHLDYKNFGDFYKYYGLYPVLKKECQTTVFAHLPSRFEVGVQYLIPNVTYRVYARTISRVGKSKLSSRHFIIKTPTIIPTVEKTRQESHS